MLTKFYINYLINVELFNTLNLSQRDHILTSYYVYFNCFHIAFIPHLYFLSFTSPHSNYYLSSNQKLVVRLHFVLDDIDLYFNY